MSAAVSALWASSHYWERSRHSPQLFIGRSPAISSEASVKYLLLRSFATASFLYGVAMMFGATGWTSIATISASLVLFNGSGGPLLAYLGVALMFVGLGFKVTAAPFHIW